MSGGRQMTALLYTPFTTTSQENYTVCTEDLLSLVLLLARKTVHVHEGKTKGVTTEYTARDPVICKMLWIKCLFLMIILFLFLFLLLCSNELNSWSAQHFVENKMFKCIFFFLLFLCNDGEFLDLECYKNMLFVGWSWDGITIIYIIK